MTKSVKTNVVSEINFNLMSDALVQRFKRQPSQDIQNAFNYMTKHKAALIKGFNMLDKEAFNKLIACHANSEKGTVNYIAVKVFVKVLKMLVAISQNLVSAIDTYTVTLIANALANSNSITSKTADVSLTKNLEYDALDNVQTVKYKKRVEVSTASTQKSSSREELRHLGLALCIKGKRDDAITLSDNGIKIFSEMFK